MKKLILTMPDTDLYMNWGYGGSNNGFYKSPGSYTEGNTTSKDFKAMYNIY